MAAVDDLSRRASNLPAKSRSTTLRVLALGMVLGVAALFPACSKDSPNCPVDDGDPCTLDQCQAGVAVNDYLGDGHPCFVGQLQGACKAGSCAIPCASVSQCNDGLPCTSADCVQGTCVIEVDDHQTAPEDGNPCTEEHCLDGKVVSWQRPNGSACPGGGCETGVCGSCKVPSDCGSTTECRAWFCEEGHCVTNDKAAGTLVLDGSIDGDCRSLICDGAGQVTTVPAPGDIPWSHEDCFEWLCVGVTPLRSPKIGTTCLMDNGLIGKCSEDGSCVQCVQDLDCPIAYRCEGNICLKCGDAYPNGNEICGGSCGQCKATACDEDNDCASGHCIFTNGAPARVCCGSDCAGVCQQCNALTGACTPVATNQKDDSCFEIGMACAASQQCKTMKGYPCVQGIECISGSCINGLCN